VLNKLRGRISVQADGQMKTGRDVVVGALLGADEFGFATAPLVVEGCIMMRKCHLNTCPVGIATQDPELIRKFEGKPEHVINYFFFVAEEVREWMAKLGVRRFDELIGRADLLDVKAGVEHWKAKGLDFSRLFYRPATAAGVAIHQSSRRTTASRSTRPRADRAGAPALDKKKAGRDPEPHLQPQPHGGRDALGPGRAPPRPRGLADDCIHVNFTGTAGQSFGAWLAHGITFELEGDANDYVGKGLSGGRLIVYPPKSSPIVPEDNIIVGNTVMYGAITARPISAAWPASASACATRARPPSSRAWATTAAST
jgi:glutamate synthase (NADPH/NADH) large chain